jgi:hypothetical protein
MLMRTAVVGIRASTDAGRGGAATVIRLTESWRIARDALPLLAAHLIGTGVQVKRIKQEQPTAKE